MTDAYRDKCRHFNGVQHDCCKAGIRYKDVEVNQEERPRVRLPCADFGIPIALPLVDSCSQRSFLTQAEHEARRAEIDAAVDRMLAMSAAGKCHVCGADAEPSRIVGRCKYAACGHRLGQV